MKEKIINFISKIGKGKRTIHYDMSNNYIACYNEAYGVAINRKKLIKHPTAATYSYTYYGFIYLWLTIILHLVTYITYRILGYTPFICFLSNIVSIFYFCIALYFLIYIIRVCCSKCRKRKGSFEVDKRGIIDSTFDGIKILFEWKKIKMVIIKKYTITILTDTPIFFFVNKEIEPILIPALKAYNKEIIIIKKNKRIK